MGFITSPNAARSPGVYGLLMKPPRVIRGISLGYIGYVAQFDAGPVGVGKLPESGDDLVQTYEPNGVPRHKSGWYGVLPQLSAPWYVVGIKGSGYASASLSRAGTGGNIVATAKSPGVWANPMTWQIAAASNGDTNARDHIFTLTDPVSGTTQETYRNVAFMQDMTALLAKSRLLASLVFSGGTMTAWPASTTLALSTGTAGSDGSAPTANDYKAGFDQLALKKQVTIVVTDDCGDSIRAAVNTDLQAHTSDLYDRVGFITGNKANDWATTKTDKANYQHETVTYCGAWVQVFDDSGLNLVDVPLSIFCAVLRANLPVHWSIANHDPQATTYLQQIKGVATATGYSIASKTIRDEATDFQIVLPQQGVGSQPGVDGPWQLLHGRSCNTTSGYQYECVTWYRIYVLRSLAGPYDVYVNGPNDLDSGLEIQAITNTWLEGEASAKHLTQSLDDDGVTLLPPYQTSIFGVNSGSTMANGDFYIEIDGHHPGVRERIFIKLNVGETVSIRRAA